MLENLKEFLAKSYTAFHAVENAKAILQENGFLPLKETEDWEIEENGKYYLERGGCALIAFTVGNLDTFSFKIAAAHLDSPALKIKENPVMKTENYEKLNGETYAPLMFFNGMCQTADGPISYLNNPYLEDNLALSLQMKLLAEAYYPGLTRPNFLKAYQYNQHLMPRYTLVEAGFDTNTFDEVCRSMVPLAKILDAVLSDPDAVKLAGGQ